MAIHLQSRSNPDAVQNAREAAANSYLHEKNARITIENQANARNNSEKISGSDRAASSVKLPNSRKSGYDSPWRNTAHLVSTSRRLTELNDSVSRLKTDSDSAYKAAQSAFMRYRLDPSDENGAEYNAAYTTYRSAIDKYNSALPGFEAAKTEYLSAYDTYNTEYEERKKAYEEQQEALKRQLAVQAGLRTESGGLPTAKDMVERMDQGLAMKRAAAERNRPRTVEEYDSAIAEAQNRLLRQQDIQRQREEDAELSDEEYARVNSNYSQLSPDYKPLQEGETSPLTAMVRDYQRDMTQLNAAQTDLEDLKRGRYYAEQNEQANAIQKQVALALEASGKSVQDYADAPAPSQYEAYAWRYFTPEEKATYTWLKEQAAASGADADALNRAYSLFAPDASQTMQAYEEALDRQKRIDQRADDYLEMIRGRITQRDYARLSQTVANMPKPAQAAYGAVAGALVKPFAYAEVAANAARQAITGDYKPVDINAGGVALTRSANQAREATLPDDTLGNLLASTAYSMGDNLISLGLSTATGLGEAGTLIWLGLTSAGDTSVSNILNGKSSAHAAGMGAASGSIEMLTEKMGLDNLFKIAGSSGARGVKSFVSSLLSQMGSEGGEEIVSEFANMLVDAVVNGDDSEYRQYIRSAEQSGVSHDNAVKAANLQFFIKNPVLAGLGGAISGMAFGASGYAFDTATMRRNGNLFARADIAPQLLSAVKSDVNLRSNDDAQRIAKSVQAKLDANKKLSPLELGELGAMLPSDTVTNILSDAAQKNPLAFADASGNLSAKTLARLGMRVRQGGDEGIERVLAQGLNADKSSEAYRLATEISDARKAFRPVSDEQYGRYLVALSKVTDSAQTNAPAQTANVSEAQNNAVQQEGQENDGNVSMASSSPYNAKKAPTEFLSAVSDSVKSFVQRVKDGKAAKSERISTGNVSNRLAGDVKSITGIDVSGRENRLTSDTVRHILNRHGESGAANHSMSNIEDIARIQWVLDNYDNIELAGTSREYRNGDNTPAQTVLISKKIDGTYYVVEAVPNVREKYLAVVSAYINQSGTLEVSKSASAAPNFTSETSSESSLATTISQNMRDVKENFLPTAENTRLETTANAPTYDSMPDDDSIGSSQAFSAAQTQQEDENYPDNAAVLTPEDYRRKRDNITRMFDRFQEAHNEGRLSDSQYDNLLEDLDDQLAELDRLWSERNYTEAPAEEAVPRAELPTGDGVTRISQEQSDRVRSIASALNVDVEFFDEAPDELGGIRNGYYDENTGKLHINVRSENPVAQIVAHELTHSLEKTDFYAKLAKLVERGYTNSGTDVNQLFQNVREYYASHGIKLSPMGCVHEVVASYVEKYLLTDETTIREIANADISLATRFRDLLDRFIVRFGRADQNDVRFLRHARYLYAQAIREVNSRDYRDAVRVSEAADADIAPDDTTAQDNAENYPDFVPDDWKYDEQADFEGGFDYEAGREYSITQTVDGRSVAVVDNDILADIDLSKWDRETKELVRKTASQELKKFGNDIYANGNHYKINKKIRDEYTRSNDADKLYRINKEAFYDKMRTADVLDDVIASTEFGETDGQLTHNRNDNLVDFMHGKVLIQSGNNKYEASTIIGITDKNEFRFHDIEDIRPTTFKLKEESSSAVSELSPINAMPEDSSFGATISQDSGNVKKEFSISQRNSDSVISRLLNEADQKDVAREQRGLYNWMNNRLGLATSDDRSLGRYWANALAEGYFSGNGQPDESRIREAFNDIMNNLQGSESENYSSYGREVLADMRSTKIFVPEDVRKSITDYNAFRKSVLGTLRLSADPSAMPIDTYYGELNSRWRWLFPEDVTNQADMLERMADVASSIRADRYTGSTDVEQVGMRDALFNDFSAAVHDMYENIHGFLPSVTDAKADEQSRLDTAERQMQYSDRERELYYESARRDVLANQHSLDSAIEQLSITDNDRREGFERSQADREADRRADRENLDRTMENAFEARNTYQVDDEYVPPETPTTIEEAYETYRGLKNARIRFETAQNHADLNQEQRNIVGQLLRREITPDSIHGSDRARILEYYEARRDYDDYLRAVSQYKTTLRDNRLQEAEELLKGSEVWHDKKAGILYSRETMERNIEDIVFTADGKRDTERAKDINDKYFVPVHKAEAESARFKRQYRDRVRALGLSEKVAKGNTVSESYAVQLYGEASDAIRLLERSRNTQSTRQGKTLDDWNAVLNDLWTSNPNLDREKIRSAAREFSKIYNELFDRMNDARVANGYEPVNYRRGYFPHFQTGEDSMLNRFGAALGINLAVDNLPTTINGLTHTFKPGITWFGNANQRTGYQTAYDAVQGFDRYIQGVSDVIFQTENIQNLRALASQIRYRAGDENIQREIDRIRALENVSDTQKEQLIYDFTQNQRYALSNLVSELDEYTNRLANKKTQNDRLMEKMLGRRFYTFMKNMESRVGANMIAANLSSAMTNFIPLTQTWGQVSTPDMLHGMWDTLRNMKETDRFIDRSDFLTNRRGDDPLVKTQVQKISEVLGKPMEWVDSYTSESVVRALYYSNLRAGMTEESAMQDADSRAARIMADRSKGSMPTLFEAKNPLIKAFTQFQLEVNNQFSEVFKDLPRGIRDKTVGQAAAVLLKYFIGAFLYNEAYEALVGRRPALDPIGIINDSVGDFTGYELPNILETTAATITGNGTGWGTDAFRTDKDEDAMPNLAENLFDELPFASGISLAANLMGWETSSDVGRIPVASAAPDFKKLYDAATNSDWDSTYRWKTAAEEISNLGYVALPFGYNQAQKIAKGLIALRRGGSFKAQSSGGEELQYPVYKDSTADIIGSAVRLALFGKSSLPTQRDWVESDFKSLSVKETDVYKALMEDDVTDREAWKILIDLKSMDADRDENGEITESASAKKREYLRNADIPSSAKATIYYGLLATDTDRKALEAMPESSDIAEAGRVMMELRDAAADGDKTKSSVERDILRESSLSGADFAALFMSKLASDRDNEIMDALIDTGANMEAAARIIMDIKDSDTAGGREALRNADLPEDAKKQLYMEYFTNGKEKRSDQIQAFADEGLTLDDFLTIQNGFSEFDAQEDRKAAQKATDFSHWLDRQNYSDSAKELAKETFKYFSFVPSDSAKYESFKKSGLDSETAYNLSEAVSALTPVEGEKTVSDLQKWQTAVTMLSSEREQLSALKTLMTKEQYEKLETAVSGGVTPLSYLQMKSDLPSYDINGNGSLSDSDYAAYLADAKLSAHDTLALAASLFGSEEVSKAGNLTAYGKLKSAVDGGMDVRTTCSMMADGVNVAKALTFLDAGLPASDAESAARALTFLADGDDDKVSDVQRERALIDAVSPEYQLDALTALYATNSNKTSTLRNYTIAAAYSITPDYYALFREQLPNYDTSGSKGSYSQAEIEAAIDGIFGGSSSGFVLPSAAGSSAPSSRTLTNTQKAVIWQLSTSSTSAKSNPYSVSVGNEILAAKKAAKTSSGDSDSASGFILPSMSDSSASSSGFVLPSMRN